MNNYRNWKTYWDEFTRIGSKEECTQLVTSERHWERILKMYIASKRLGKLCRIYSDCLQTVYFNVVF